MKVEFDGQHMYAEMNEENNPGFHPDDAPMAGRAFVREHIGTICGGVSLVLSLLLLLMGMVFNYGTAFLYSLIGDSAIYYAVTERIVCIIPAVLSIAFGIISIVMHSKVKTAESTVGMVLGITGVATAVVSLLIKAILTF